MATLRLPGLLTGIDTNKLISQLMAVERRTLNTYEDRISLWEQRQTALNNLESNLSTLRSSIRALSDADELRAFNVTSSDSEIITAEASYNAFEGNHTVVVNQLASAERWVHTAGLEYAEDYVGDGDPGTFIYSYNNKETVITTTSETTLEDLVGLINNDANNPGVTASLLYYNGTYHLVLNGNEAGTDYKIFVNSSSTEVWQSDGAFTVNSDNATLSTKITDLDQFEWNGDSALSGNEQIEITGADHNGNAISQVDLDITEHTTIGHLISEINDAFDGIATARFENGEIILTDKTSGTSNLSITLTYDQGSGNTMLNGLGMSFSTEGGSTTANLEGFAPGDFTLSQVAQDSKIKVDGFPSDSPVAEVQHLNFVDRASGGTWTLTYDGQTTADLSYDATTAEVQAALEALPNVSAGDITVGGDRLSINNGTMTFTFTDTAGDVNMLVIDPSSLTPSDPSNWLMTEQTKGQDGWISRSSNTVDDVIYGVALHLHDTTDANGEAITLTRNTESVKEKLSSLVDAYNLVVTYIEEVAGYDEDTETRGVLTGDYVVSTIKTLLRDPLVAQTSGFIEDIDSFLMPGQIGLELDRDGILSLDTNVFDEAIANDYMDVLALIGADKTGSSDSNTIEFYGASSNYTTAGSYRIKVEYDASGDIYKAWIKLSSEDDSQYREATINGNVITGNSTFDDNGDPVYPENALQVTAPTTGTPSSTIYATVRVKQGFAGAMEDVLDRILKSSTGAMDIDQEHVEDQIEYLEDKIELEEYRLEQREARLVTRFAALERTLALLQNQMAALGFGYTQS